MSPSPRTPEEQFERFREAGDVGALAAVFEATAGDLLKLALQLSDDPALAEDALQSTFVTAMEKAASFERGRTLMPWLCGILQLHCKALRARARRTADPARLPFARNGRDPLDAAMDGEVDRGLREAIDALPAAHRTVVVLRLLHGMEPAAIAHALGEAPGTVRVRLHRGLAMLRARLPRGIATPALMLPVLQFTQERGLGLIGREVLRTAQRLAPTPTTGAALGAAAIAMKKLIFAVVAATLLVLTGVAVGGFGPATPSPSVGEPTVVAERSAQPPTGERAAAVDPSRAADSGDPARREVADGVAQVERRGIRVVARRGGDRAAAARVGITVLPHDGRHPDLHAMRRLTDAEGVALFDDLEPGRYGVYVDRSAHELKPEEPPPIENVIGPDLPEGAWFADVSTVVQGRLQLQAGEVVQELARIISVRTQLQQFVLPKPTAIENRLIDLSTISRSAVSSSGVITMLGGPMLVPVPDFRLSSELPDRGPNVLVDVTDGYTVVSIEVDGGVTVAGRVLDPDTEPVEGAEIWVVRDNGRTAFPVATSRRDGRFTIAEIEAGTTLHARKRGYASSGLVEANADAEIDLVLGARAHAVTGRVVDWSGEPIADARVRVGDPDQDDARRVQVPTDADGHFECLAPALGAVPVLVLAPGFQPWLGEAEVGESGTAPLEIVMRAGAIVAGFVRGPDDEPREGVLVVARAVDQPETDVRSGPNGAYRLECVPPGPITLFVEQSDEHRGAEQKEVATAGVEHHVDIALRPWAHIRGRLTDAAGQPLPRAKLYAVPTDAARFPVSDARSTDDGSFEIRTMPGALYAIDVIPEANQPYHFQVFRGGDGGQIMLSFAMADGSSFGGDRGRRRVSCSWLGPITAERRGLEIQLPQNLVPSAHLKGRVMTPAATPLAGSLRITVDGSSRSVGLDDEGAFDIGPLVPGAYTFAIQPEDDSLATLTLPVTALEPSQTLDLGLLYALPKGPASGGR